MSTRPTEWAHVSQETADRILAELTKHADMDGVTTISNGVVAAALHINEAGCRLRGSGHDPNWAASDCGRVWWPQGSRTEAAMTPPTPTHDPEAARAHAEHIAEQNAEYWSEATKFNPRDVPEPPELAELSKALEAQRLYDSALCATCGQTRRHHGPTAKRLDPGCVFVEPS